jgi:hypothetical protein
LRTIHFDGSILVILPIVMIERGVDEGDLEQPLISVDAR